MKNRMLGVFALCAAVFVTSVSVRAGDESPYGEQGWYKDSSNNYHVRGGDAVALTNLFTVMQAGKIKNRTVFLAAGTYNLSGISMYSGDHLRLTANMSGTKVVGEEGTTAKDVILKGGGATDKRRIFNFGQRMDLKGLTLTGGYASGSGGAVTKYDTTAATGSTLFDCIVSNNYATGTGGAIYQVCASNALFEANSTRGNGGAVGNSNKLIDCIIRGNAATNSNSTCGGAVHSGTLIHCEVYDNVASNRGGALYSVDGRDNVISNNWSLNRGDFNTVLDACTISNSVIACNSANGRGAITYGGTYEGCVFISNICTRSEGLFRGIFNRCVFKGNYHKASGGAFFNGGNSSGATVYNSLIVSNGVAGAASSVGSASNSKFYNCTVVGHQSTTAPFGANALLVNTIIADSLAFDVKQDDPSTMTNCLWVTQSADDPIEASKVVDGIWLKGRPVRFVDPVKGDYRLQRGSKARNAGYQDDDYIAVVGPIDLNGDPRAYEGDGPAKAIIDIGCYECQIPAPGLMMIVK